MAGSGRGSRPGRRRRAPLPPLPAPVTALDSGSGGPAAGTVSKLIETAVPSYLSIEVGCRQRHFHESALVIRFHVNGMH